jgi:hypothetical protein
MDVRPIHRTVYDTTINPPRDVERYSNGSIRQYTTGKDTFLLGEEADTARRLQFEAPVK